MTLNIEDELLAEATPEELEAYRVWLESQSLEEAAADVAALERDWRAWLWGLFPSYVRAGFAKHHEELWEWVWAIEDGKRADPFVAVWPRGGGKSTAAELACVALGARRRRRYGWYICATQEQADDHVANVATMLESAGVARLYPDLAERQVGKFGHVKGWRRNRLWTRSGFVLDAVGLDTAARGVKLDEERFDLAIVDDIDSEDDSPGVVAKKIASLTRRMLPAGSAHASVLAIQNLVHSESIFAQLVDGRAEFLATRTVSGPVPAVEGLVTERREGRTVIVSGEPTWAGQSLEGCQSDIDDFGESAFRLEAQHEVDLLEGGMFSETEFVRCLPEDVPELVRTTVWVDPAVTSGDASDSVGIQADGLAEDGRIFRLRSIEKRMSPRDALATAIRWAIDLGSTTVGVETDQGGDTWESVYREALTDVEIPHGVHPPRFKWAKAGAGHGPKTARAQRMLVFYERNPSAFVHVIGPHSVLERALRRFNPPKGKPWDLADAAYWAADDLLGGLKRKVGANPGALRRPVGSVVR